MDRSTFKSWWVHGQFVASESLEPEWMEKTFVHNGTVHTVRVETDPDNHSWRVDGIYVCDRITTNTGVVEIGVPGQTLFRYPSGDNQWGQFGRTSTPNVAPATTLADGTREWFVNGVRFAFTVDGEPTNWALTLPNVQRTFDEQGRLHNTEGPAVLQNGIRQWWLDGVHISTQDECPWPGLTGTQLVLLARLVREGNSIDTARELVAALT